MCGFISKVTHQNIYMNKKTGTYCTIVFILFIAFNAQSQEIVLKQDVDADTIKSEQGPNKKVFAHTYLGYGFAAMPADGKGSNVIYGASHSFLFGYRMKYKLTNWYALGYDINYNYRHSRLSQSIYKTFPNTAKHDKESIRFHNLNLNLYQRFNFGQRGNSLGKYIDLGGYGEWAFSIAHQYTDDYAGYNKNGARTSIVKNKDLRYTNRFNYGLLIRFGYNKFVLFADYRLSDQFLSKFHYDELPRLTAGIQLQIQ